MRRALSLSTVLILLTASLALARAAQTTSAVGTWDITIESPQGKRTSMLIIKQEGDKLTGVIKSQRGERPLDSVTVKGNEITMLMTINAQGQELQVTYKGTIEKDSMKGTADFGGFAEGAWSAVPHTEGTAPSGPPPARPTPPPPAAAVNITGVWNFTVETPAGTGSPVFTFKQEGENLSGTYKGQFGEKNVTGSVKGGDVKFSMKVSYEGQDMEITYTGKVEGASMKGTAKLGDLGEAAWTAKKQ
jgi:hypothetical protein